MSRTSAIEIQDFSLWDKMKSRRALFSFDLELTARCNMNCRHCYINLPAGNQAARRNELSLDEIGQIADQTVEMGAMWCLLTGGEPLLREDFADIYMLLKRKGLLVSVFTNATAIRAEHIALFKKYPPRDIEVTIYGASRQTYEAVTRTPGSYARFVRGLDALFEAGVRVRLKAMALRSNLEDMEAIATFGHQRTKDYYRFDPVLHLRYDGNDQRNAEIRQERLTPEEIVALERADEKRFGALQKNCDTLINQDLTHFGCNHLFHCGAGEGSFNIGYDGTFRLCSSLWAPGTTVNLRETPLRLAWETLIPQVRDLRSQDVEFLNTCRKCAIINLCLHCPAHAHLETGAMDGATPYFCAVAHAARPRSKPSLPINRMPEAPSLRTRLRTALRLGRALRLLWQTAPRWTLVNVALVFVQGVLPLVALYLIKRILDAVTTSLAGIQQVNAFQPVVIWILLAVAVAILTNVIRSISEYASEAQSLQVTDAVADILHAQSIVADLEYYEDPGYFDTLHRAQQEAPYRPTDIINQLIQFAQNGISLLGILGLLISFNWSLALVLILAAVPGALARVMNSRRMFRFEQEQTEKERRAWYYHYILTDIPFAKELRLFNLGEFFKNRYRDLRQQIRTGRLTLSRRRIGSDLLAQLLATVAIFGSLAWIAWQTVLGKVTISNLMIYYLGFQSGLTYLQGVLHALTGLYEDNLFLANLDKFLNLKPKIAAPEQPRSIPHPMPGTVAFRNVGFTYSSRDQETLHDINLTVKPGEVIALVGENGSGKTTLVKLLCRLYDPTHGTIAVDGIDLRDIDPVEWRREISVIFQDYAHYALKAWENIWLGDVKSAPDPKRLEEVSHRSGADEVIHRLPQAYDTMLGQWFQEGQELSVGEWQKIALARTFWRNARILILDEPTSSLDPLAEAELFTHFRELLDSCSAILISHRFSTVQMADCIYVMEQGRIVEGGTHAALLAQNGRYARLYRAQAEHYQER